jgi:hypothetical protein
MATEKRVGNENQSDKQKANLQKANEALAAKDEAKKEALQKAQQANIGKDSEHPVVGSQAHVDKYGW